MIQRFHIISHTPCTMPQAAITHKLAKSLTNDLRGHNAINPPEAIEIDLQRAVLRSINEVGTFETLRTITNFVGTLKPITAKGRSVQ